MFNHTNAPPPDERVQPLPGIRTFLITYYEAAQDYTPGIDPDPGNQTAVVLAHTTSLESGVLTFFCLEQEGKTLSLRCMRAFAPGVWREMKELGGVPKTH